MDASNRQRWLDLELVDLYHRNVPAPVLALNPILALVLAFLLGDLFPRGLLVFWVAVVTLVALFNIWRNHLYRRARAADPLQVDRWRRWFSLGALLNGIAGAAAARSSTCLPNRCTACSSCW